MIKHMRKILMSALFALVPTNAFSAGDIDCEKLSLKAQEGVLTAEEKVSFKKCVLGIAGGKNSELNNAVRDIKAGPGANNDIRRVFSNSPEL